MYYSPRVPFTATLQSIPDGRDGTLATLKAMREFVRAGKYSLPVRQKAVSLTSALKQKDWVGELKAVHHFVRDEIRYVRDIRGIETVQTPEITLQIGSGDCDDKSVLGASLLESIGHPTRLVAIGFSPDDFAHVYFESLIGKRWIALETTEPVELGWSAPNAVSRLIVHN